MEFQDQNEKGRYFALYHNFNNFLFDGHGYIKHMLSIKALALNPFVMLMLDTQHVVTIIIRCLWLYNEIKPYIHKLNCSIRYPFSPLNYIRFQFILITVPVFFILDEEMEDCWELRNNYVIFFLKLWFLVTL